MHAVYLSLADPARPSPPSAPCVPLAVHIRQKETMIYHSLSRYSARNPYNKNPKQVTQQCETIPKKNKVDLHFFVVCYTYYGAVMTLCINIHIPQALALYLVDHTVQESKGTSRDANTTHSRR